MQTNLTNVLPFEPPLWCINGHVHTVAQSLLTHAPNPAFKHVTIPTPDNDFLELDVIYSQNDRPVIALFHGLEGSTDRYYIRALMQAFSQINYSVVAVNFRSCGAHMNRRRRFYHSGETRDLATVFSWMQKRFPKSAIGAVGFSLGGNVLLKSLGEEQNAHPAKAAVAVSVPYHLKTGALRISQGFNQVYEHLFLKSLTQKLKMKRQIYPDLPTFSGSTLFEFDDQVTGPVHGFRNANDYYATCSSRKFVEAIATPTLLIHSADDPLCPVDIMPLRRIKQNPNLDFIITKEGGHVGFRSRPKGWLNKIIVNYIHQKID